MLASACDSKAALTGLSDDDDEASDPPPCRTRAGHKKTPAVPTNPDPARDVARLPPRPRPQPTVKPLKPMRNLSGPGTRPRSPSVPIKLDPDYVPLSPLPPQQLLPPIVVSPPYPEAGFSPPLDRARKHVKLAATVPLSPQAPPRTVKPMPTNFRKHKWPGDAPARLMGEALQPALRQPAVTGGSRLAPPPNQPQASCLSPAPHHYPYPQPPFICRGPSQLPPMNAHNRQMPSGHPYPSEQELFARFAHWQSMQGSAPLWHAGEVQEEYSEYYQPAGPQTDWSDEGAYYQ